MWEGGEGGGTLRMLPPLQRSALLAGASGAQHGGLQQAAVASPPLATSPL